MCDVTFLVAARASCRAEREMDETVRYCSAPPSLYLDQGPYPWYWIIHTHFSTVTLRTQSPKTGSDEKKLTIFFNNQYQTNNG